MITMIIYRLIMYAEGSSITSKNSEVLVALCTWITRQETTYSLLFHDLFLKSHGSSMQCQWWWTRASIWYPESIRYSPDMLTWEAWNKREISGIWHDGGWNQAYKHAFNLLSESELCHTHNHWLKWFYGSGHISYSSWLSHEMVYVHCLWF